MALCTAASVSPAAAAPAPRHQPDAASLEARLFLAHMAEPLVPIGPTAAVEDKALLDAVAAWERRTSADGFSALTGFLAAHPNSPWRVAVLTNLGLSDVHEGYFSRALAVWQEAWRDGKNATGVRAHALTDRAVGELVRLDARLGHEKQLAALLTDIGNRPVTGPGAEMVRDGHEMLWRVRHDPTHLRLCGPTALKLLMLAEGRKPEEVRFLDKVQAGPRGTSLAELARFAREGHFPVRMIRRRPGEKVPVPSVVHWKVGHFAAIVGKENGRYKIEDPSFGPQPLWVTKAALDAEASGYFLAPASAERGTGWRNVAANTAAGVWGAGTFSAYGSNPSGGDNSDPNTGTPPKCKTTCSCGGMCGYGIDEQRVSLNLTDTPVGYTPPIGPSARVTLGYDQRDTNQPGNLNYFNVGPKWTLSWLSFVQDYPTQPGVTVTSYQRNGGVYTYTGYDSGSGDFAPQEDDASVLVLNPNGSYERLLKDGSVEHYNHSDGGTAPRRVFLGEIVDPQGNALTLNYSNTGGVVRLVSLTDAAGRQTTFTYGGGNPLLITRITDPFGRRASLGYDGSGRLSSITDVLGLTSAFTYDTSGFVSQMTTAYGTTYFSSDDTNGGPPRFLKIIDPLGYGEREESPQPAPVASADPAGGPQGMDTYNIYLNYRDSAHWDKYQYVAAGCGSPGGCDTTAGYADARITHFHHEAAGCGWQAIEWDTVESRKEPLENRVWYNYPGQCQPFINGTYDEPSAIGRLLDDGSTQLTQIAYNATGNRTQFTDPNGRQTTITYASNGVDPIAIAQATGSGNATIAQFTYSGIHGRPATYTDAAGQVWTYTYNAAGQVTSRTDPLGEKTSWNYDGTGDLTSIVNNESHTAASFTYDAFDRVAAYTDAAGWTASYSYDAADRLTAIAYPDGSSQLYGYNKLDLASYTDRADHQWTYTHDADRNLVAVADPLGHTTSYTYYGNGRLKTLTDANGNVTAWGIDLEGRPTFKRYPDGTKTTYAYQNSTSLLAQRTDGLGQSADYSYDIDNRLAGIVYANAVNPTPNVAFTWDPYFVRLATMADGSGTTAYSYVPPGSLGALKLQQETGPYAAIGYVYDQLGRLAWRTVGGAAAEGFSYDPIGRLSHDSTALGTFALPHYGQTMQPTGWSLVGGGGLSTSWSYLTNANDRRLASIANTPGRTYNFTTTPTDLIAAIGEVPSPPGQSWAFFYDNANRLKRGNSTTEGNYAYALDPVGNVTAYGAVPATYNANNQLTSLNGVPYTWDAAGELISDGSRTYSWDAAHRLIGISYAAQPGMTTAFGYDGMGRRVAMTTTVNGTPTTTFYVWCGHKLCQSQNGDHSIARQYYREGEYIPSEQASLYYGPDQLGSVRDAYATSPLFNVPQAYDYDPYGDPLVVPTNGPLTDFRYAHMFYHADSGLYLTEHRAYDPRTGRWLTRDPLGEGSDPAANLYRYVGGNPISLLDPLGLDTGGMGYSYVPPGDPFPSPPGGSGSPCPPGDDAGPPTVLQGAAAAPPSPDGGGFEPVDGPDIGPGYPAYDGPTILLAGYFTSNIDSSAARALGMSRNQLGDAVHAIKGALGLGGADNVLLHVPSGDIYYNDEVIGNVRDE